MEELNESVSTIDLCESTDEENERSSSNTGSNSTTDPQIDNNRASSNRVSPDSFDLNQASGSNSTTDSTTNSTSPHINYMMLLQICKDRDTCLNWCVKHNLLNDTRTCNAGKHEIKWSKKISNDDDHALNRVFRCYKHAKTNLKGVSAAKGTWFEHRKLKIEDVLKMTYFFSHNYSYEQVKHEIQQHTLKEDGS